MNLKVISDGMFQSNSYIIENSGECVVIDCGVSADKIMDVVNEFNSKLKYIILTHGHIDHIVQINLLKQKVDAKVLIHDEDKQMLTDSYENGSALFMRNPLTFTAADKILSDGDSLDFGDTKIKIIHTPGHTKGGICINIDEYLFTGDTLFKGSIGRTDLAGGDYKQIIASIREKLFTLPDEYIVLPGHGPSSTIGIEKSTNPYVR